RVGVGVEGLEVVAVVAPGAEVEDAAQAAGPEVPRQAPGEDAGGGPAPGAERTERLGGLPRLQVEPAVVEVPDALEVEGRDFHRGTRLYPTLELPRRWKRPTIQTCFPSPVCYWPASRTTPPPCSRRRSSSSSR